MTVDIPTPHGPARVTVHTAAEPRAVMVLGHGAGGPVRGGDVNGHGRSRDASGVTFRTMSVCNVTPLTPPDADSPPTTVT